METGFATMTVEPSFARRSAQYLASQGYRPGQIRSALVEQLEITDSFADELISTIAVISPIAA